MGSDARFLESGLTKSMAKTSYVTEKTVPIQWRITQTEGTEVCAPMGHGKYSIDEKKA